MAFFASLLGEWPRRFLFSRVLEKSTHQLRMDSSKVTVLYTARVNSALFLASSDCWYSGILWLVAVSHQFLPLFSHGHLPSVHVCVALCPNLPLLIRTPVIGFKLHKIWPNINVIFFIIMYRKSCLDVPALLISLSHFIHFLWVCSTLTCLNICNNVITPHDDVSIFPQVSPFLLT